MAVDDDGGLRHRADLLRRLVQFLGRGGLEPGLIRIKEHGRVQRDAERAADRADRIDVSSRPAAGTGALQVRDADEVEGLARLDELRDVERCRSAAEPSDIDP